MRSERVRRSTMTRFAALAALAVGWVWPVADAGAQQVSVQQGRPAYFAPTLRSAMAAPWPSYTGSAILPSIITQYGTAANPNGSVGWLSMTGAARTSGSGVHPFFAPLGSNGRSCGTCHLPSQGMSFTAASARARFALFGANGDPLFAPVDGSNCPNQVPRSETKAGRFGGLVGRGYDSARARSLLLQDGLIRVFLPVPANRDYEVTVVSDPYTCNTDPAYARDPANASTRILSFYRRPMISANLASKLQFIGQTSPAQLSGNIMWDGREPSLASQAVSAIFSHAQRDPRSPPLGQGPLSETDAVIKAIVDYELGFFVAQQSDRLAGALDASGATGGVRNFAAATDGKSILPDRLVPSVSPPFDEYAAWGGNTSWLWSTNAARQSIKRGQDLFNGTNPRGLFSVSNVAGFNDAIGLGKDVPFPGVACATCHHGKHTGSDLFAANQRDIGTTGVSPAVGQPLRWDLPVFQITCHGSGHPFLGTSFKTNDLGMGMISGKCSDVGKITVPQLRGLASHAPFFHDGSADTLWDVVSFYNRRFNINLTPQERMDLTNFLSAL